MPVLMRGPPARGSWWGRNWSGVDPPLSLQPRLPHGLLSVHRVFFRPMALFVFETGPSPYLPGWGQGCGLRVLGFTAWSHVSLDTESGSWHIFGVPCLGSPLPRLCSLALSPLGGRGGGGHSNSHGKLHPKK